MLTRVFNRTDATGPIRCWGTLHVDLTGKQLGGWVTDSWTDSLIPNPYYPYPGATLILAPRLLWFSEGKFWEMSLHVDLGSSRIEIFGEAKKEPEREEFLRSQIAMWEAEWSEIVEKTIIPILPNKLKYTTTT